MGGNESLAAEAFIVLDVVVQTMKGSEKGKKVINMDCRKV